MQLSLKFLSYLNLEIKLTEKRKHNTDQYFVSNRISEWSSLNIFLMGVLSFDNTMHFSIVFIRAFFFFFFLFFDIMHSLN